MSLARILSCAIITLALASCTRQPTTTYTASSDNQQTIDYQTLASQTQFADTFGKLIQQKSYSTANQLLATMSTTDFYPNVKAQIQLDQSELLLALDQPKAALKLLNNLSTASLPNESLNRYYLLLAQSSYRSDLPLQSALNLLHTNNLTAEQQQEVWQRLQLASIYQLQKANKSRNNTPTQSAWLKLALISKYQSNNSTALYQQLNNWEKQYRIDTGLIPKKTDKAITIKKIAVLLPLSGSYSALGNTVKDGILAAYYNNLAKNPQTPSINFYDTNNADLKTIYKQLKANSGDLIIGPLTKKNTILLTNKIKPNIPTITLNSLSSSNTNNTIYTYGLSPADEARQAADLARRKGHSRALIITSDDERGHLIANAYQARWQQLGGTVTQTAYYKNATGLSSAISSVLKINQSRSRLVNLEHLLGERLTFSARRRHDFDVIFVGATEAVAKQLKPLLKFYYVSNVPVYATSSIYQGNPNYKSSDLEGMVFCDIPAIIKPTKAMKLVQSEGLKSWGHNAEKYNRLYALGYDAFNISANINRIRSLPHFPYSGLTGRITLDTQSNNLQRQLVCARFIYGKVRPFS